MPPAWVPSEATFTRVVWPVWRSWTKASTSGLVSPGTRLVAPETNATNRPVALIAGRALPSLAWVPSEARLTRVVSPAWRSRTKTSPKAFVSSGTRLAAEVSKATKRPSALVEGLALGKSACVPSEATLTRVVSGELPTAEGLQAPASRIERARLSPTNAAPRLEGGRIAMASTPHEGQILANL